MLERESGMESWPFDVTDAGRACAGLTAHLEYKSPRINAKTAENVLTFIAKLQHLILLLRFPLYQVENLAA
jgi:hypothetical protein